MYDDIKKRLQPGSIIPVSRGATSELISELQWLFNENERLSAGLREIKNCTSEAYPIKSESLISEIHTLTKIHLGEID